MMESTSKVQPQITNSLSRFSLRAYVEMFRSRCAFEWQIRGKSSAREKNKIYPSRGRMGKTVFAKFASTSDPDRPLSHELARVAARVFVDSFAETQRMTEWDATRKRRVDIFSYLRSRSLRLSTKSVSIGTGPLRDPRARRNRARLIHFRLRSTTRIRMNPPSKSPLRIEHGVRGAPRWSVKRNDFGVAVPHFFKRIAIPLRGERSPNPFVGHADTILWIRLLLAETFWQ